LASWNLQEGTLRSEFKILDDEREALTKIKQALPADLEARRQELAEELRTSYDGKRPHYDTGKTTDAYDDLLYRLAHNVSN